MVAELGQFALIVALLTAALQGVLPLLGTWRGDVRLIGTARPAAFCQFAFLAIAFAVLTTVHVTNDFSVVNVVQNSHTAKPLLYRITGVWGSHEGSMLLWVLMLALFGALIALRAPDMPRDLAARTVAVQGLLGVGFLAFIVMTSNPFERVFPAPLQGRDLNPLLQDPGLAYHPPFLYFGYVGFSTAFSFAAAALIEGRVDPVWARCVRPWGLLAWSGLTIGIALGSWWAYYTLGWGGWWFWDPVENASLLPWLLGTALIHSLIVLERRDALNTWTVLLAIATFAMSLVGTFLVRSGILTSVHAFAVDPKRGVFILALMSVAVLGALLLFALRSPRLAPSGLFAPVSREGAVVLNNLLLSAATCTVFVGTLYPVFYDVMTGEKISVGTGYFDRTFVPIMLPLAVALGIGPMLAWRRGDLGGAMSRLLAAAVGVALVVAAAAWWQWGGPVLALVAIAVATWVALGALTELAERLGVRRHGVSQAWSRARGIPLRYYGMTTAHLGVAIAIAGMVGATAWSSERLVTLQRGQQLEIAGYQVRFDGVAPARGPNYEALAATLTVLRDGAEVAVMRPENRRYPSTGTAKAEAAIRTNGFADLYLVLGDGSADGSWTIRAYHRPLVPWIWIGSLIMAFGGLLSLADRLRGRIGLPRASALPVAVKAAMLLALGLAAAPALAIDPREQLSDPALEARARVIGQDLRCLVCQNQTIDDSNASLAADMRRLLRERLLAGDDDRQVRQFFIDRYGDFVVFTPPLKPATYLLWGAPVLALVVGGLLFAQIWRRAPAAKAYDPPPLSAEEEAAVSTLLQAERK